MNFEFKHIDDFECILPQWGGSPFKQHIEYYFKNYGLLFALVEISTIKNLTGIGDIYIWTDNPEKAKEKIKEYEKIIKLVQHEKQLNIAEYKCWYEYFNYSYILLFNNDSSECQKIYNRYKYDWTPYSNKKKYPLISKDEILPHEKIFDYLNLYAKKMVDFELYKYPHYAIIIKPISFPRPQKNQPPYEVGTFYLHFATSEFVSKDIYLQFINQFFIVWLKEYAVTLIEQFKEIPVFVNTEIEDCLPPWKEHPTRSKMYHTIEYYLKQIYINHKLELEEKLYAILKEVIIFILSGNLKINDDIYYVFKSIGIEDLKEKEDKLTLSEILDIYKKIIIQREIFKILLIADIDTEHIHNYFKENDITGKNYSDKVGYFWSNRFIPLKSGKTKSEIKVNETIVEIKQSLSKWEKSFIRKYIDILTQNSFINSDKADYLISELKSW